MLGGGGDDISVIYIVYPRGTISVSSLGSFSSVGSLTKPSHPSLTLSFEVHHIQDHPKKKRARKRK